MTTGNDCSKKYNKIKIKKMSLNKIKRSFQGLLYSAHQEAKPPTRQFKRAGL